MENTFDTIYRIVRRISNSFIQSFLVRFGNSLLSTRENRQNVSNIIFSKLISRHDDSMEFSWSNGTLVIVDVGVFPRNVDLYSFLVFFRACSLRRCSTIVPLLVFTDRTLSVCLDST